MAMGDIDLTIKAQDLELFLAKPDRTIIAKLSESYAKTLTLKLGGVSELAFSLPFEVDINRKLVRNPNIDIVLDRYLIKAVLGDRIEWYIISNVSDSMGEDMDAKNIIAYLLPYELGDKNIHIFQEDGINVVQALSGGNITNPDGTTYTISGLLLNTRWTLGYTDADIATQYRSFDINSSTVLDAIFQVADTYNALIVWDTENRVINFVNALNYGINRGLTINYGHYLKSLSKESKSDEMVTRFKVFGKDGMSIQGVNLNGQNYIEDYSYFMYPFQMDANDNVISSSNYMSDALCIAIVKYSDFLASKDGIFKTYLAQLDTEVDTIATLNFAMSTLKEDLAVIQNSLDIAKSMNQSTSTLETQLANKNAEIAAKQSEIDASKAVTATTNNNITTLRNSLTYFNFFTTELLDELKAYIIEREYVNEITDDEKALYEDAQKEFEKVKLPQVVLTMDIVNFLRIVESQRDWNKLNLGDIITIRYDKLKINMEAKIVEITMDFEGETITLTIANTKDILTDEEKLIKMLYQSSSAATVVNNSKTKWDGVEGAKSQINEIINNTWDAIKREISGGVDGSLTITARGLISKNTNPNKYLVMQNGVLAITGDGGSTWKHAITADGIVGERIFGKLIAGVNLTIDASDDFGTKTFTVNSTGVTILGSSLTITGGLPTSELDPAFKDSLVNLGASYNGVVIDSASGLTITKSDGTIRTRLNATDGFSFEKKNGTGWDKKLYYNATTGNMILDGELNAKSIKINGVEVIAGNKLDGDMIDSIKVQQLDATSAKITTAMIENLIVGGNVTMGANATISWSQVTSQPSIPTVPSYITSTKITSTTIESPTISAGTINGVTITGSTINGATINGGNINVKTDLYVGGKIYMDATSFTADLIFNPSNKIYSDPAASSLQIVSGSGGIWLNGVRSDRLTAVFS